MKSLALLMLFAFLFSCKDSQKLSYETKKSVSKNQEYPGKSLMQTNCYVCHSPTAAESNRIAPPMIAIKKHYINKNTTKAAFIKSMQSWIKNPTKENAKMYGAVRRFGLMQKQAFPEEAIKLISDYMFDNEIEKPEWFDDHYNRRRGIGMQNRIKKMSN